MHTTRKNVAWRAAGFSPAVRQPATCHAHGGPQPRRSPLLLLALLLPGCILLPKDESQTSKSPQVKLEQFKTAGAARNLGDFEKAAVTSEEFVAHVAQLLTDQRPLTAQRYIKRYPDVALESLRQANNAQANNVALRYVAEVHDEQCGNPQNGWLALLKDRAANPSRYAEYDAARAKFIATLLNGHAGDAVKMGLPGLVGGKGAPALPAWDAWQLHGTALLQADKPAEAAEAFAYANMAGGDSYQNVSMLLLRSDALRRAGQAEAANAVWKDAVVKAAALAASMNDPVLWERASFYRPVQFSWPEPVVLAFLNRRLGQNQQPVLSHPTATEQNQAVQDEAIIWGGIGEMRLERGEAQAALVGCKKADSLTLDASLRTRMQLRQAQAMLLLKQEPSAIAILAPLAGSSDAATAAPALAMLGAIKLQSGNGGQAQLLIERAIKLGEWSDRAEAEANLGLACLMQGNEADGLAWLHSAQDRFEKSGERASLMQSLTNEMNYFGHTKRPQQAEAIHQRLAALEANEQKVAQR
jgi:hypothetical protein